MTYPFAGRVDSIEYGITSQDLDETRVLTTIVAVATQYISDLLIGKGWSEQSVEAEQDQIRAIVEQCLPGYLDSEETITIETLATVMLPNFRRSATSNSSVIADKLGTGAKRRKPAKIK